MFQFKFQAVLNYRKQVENTRQQEFARSMRIWEKECQKLEAHYERWKECLNDWRKKQRGKISVRKIELYQQYMRGLKLDIELQAERVRSSLKEMESKREILLNAVKDTKIMEKLEEYHFTEYKSQLSRKEKKFIDDIATKRFNYKGTAR